MTTTQSTSGSMTLPTDEIGFLLNLAETDGTAVSDADFNRLASLRGLYQDRDMPVETETASVYLLIRAPGGYDAETILEGFTDQAVAEDIAATLNAYATDTYEIRAIPLNATPGRR